MHKISLVPINNSFASSSANAYLTELAVFDRGLDFGNEGSRLAADIFNDFENHILLRRHSFGPLSEMIIKSSEKRFIVISNATELLFIYDENEFKSFFDVYSLSILEAAEEVIDSAFEALHETVAVKFHIDRSELVDFIATNIENETTIDKRLISLVEGSDTLLMGVIDANDNHQIIPYVGYEFGIIFNLCGNAYHETCTYAKEELNMDILTLSQILDGDIDYYDDLRILPHQQIIVIKPDEDEYYQKFEGLIKKINSNFSYEGASINAGSTYFAKLEVIDHNYLISYIPIYGSIEKFLKLVRIKNN